MMTQANRALDPVDRLIFVWRLNLFSAHTEWAHFNQENYFL
ncbi:hypothetical protein [Leptolyngbya sp. FACHB-321]|nr:hypothetical protein [Leptolyngbya sp. FACHB-321]